MLIKDNYLGFLDLGDVVYPCLVRFFYANLETKMGAHNFYFVSLVKSVKITLTRSNLETIFRLKFTDSASSTLAP